MVIFELVFSLAFSGKNLFQGVVRNKSVTIGKDTVYDFLSNPSYNWRRLNFLLVAKLHKIISGLLNPLSEDSEGVLIFDDSTYDRNRSKKVELLARVFDHTFMKFFKGFRLLTLGWSDGNSFLGLDFILLSSADESNRYQEITKKDLDKRTCGYKRRLEAITKSTLLLEPMVKRALNAGIKAKYVLMDSWFSAPSIIETLREHLHVICMLKDQATWYYVVDGKKLRLSDVYGKLKKRRGKAKIKASTIVETTSGKKVKIVFVASTKKRGWLALLSTDVDLDDNEIIRLYGKRWDIEVYFKMAKQHLKLAKEIQLRDYDGLVAHTTIVMMRYNFLAYYQRESVDQRAWGDLFRFCCDEMQNLNFIDALQRIMTLATIAIRKNIDASERIIQDILNTVMGAAINFFGLRLEENTVVSVR